MAQLKDLLVSGQTRLINDVYIQKLQIPTTDGGTSFGYGSSGQLIKINSQNNLYWGNLIEADIPTLSPSKSGLGNAKIFYGTCSTAANQAIKQVTCNNFDVTTDFVRGAVIFVTFENQNTSATSGLKLQISNGTSSTTEKSIKYKYNDSQNNLPDTGYLQANQTYMFIYDGTNWVEQTIKYNTDTKQRTYTSSTNVDLPIAGISSAASTTAVAPQFTNTTYADSYAAIPSTSGNQATINPSTGKITATFFSGDGSELTNLDGSAISDGTVGTAYGGTGFAYNQTTGPAPNLVFASDPDNSHDGTSNHAILAPSFRPLIYDDIPDGIGIAECTDFNSSSQVFVATLKNFEYRLGLSFYLHIPQFTNPQLELSTSNSYYLSMNEELGKIISINGRQASGTLQGIYKVECNLYNQTECYNIILDERDYSTEIGYCTDSNSTFNKTVTIKYFINETTTPYCLIYFENNIDQNNNQTNTLSINGTTAHNIVITTGLNIINGLCEVAYNNSDHTYEIGPVGCRSIQLTQNNEIRFENSRGVNTPLPNISANKILAGPSTSGSSAEPSFRDLSVSSFEYTKNNNALDRGYIKFQIENQNITFPDTISNNTVFAGPTSGSNAEPRFRALTIDDIPNGIGIAYCNTAGSTAAKTAILKYGDSNTLDFYIYIAQSNEAIGLLTLSINGGTPYNIALNGVLTSASNNTLPIGLYKVIRSFSGDNPSAIIYNILTDGNKADIILNQNQSTGHLVCYQQEGANVYDFYSPIWTTDNTQIARYNQSNSYNSFLLENWTDTEITIDNNQNYEIVIGSKPLYSFANLFVTLPSFIIDSSSCKFFDNIYDEKNPFIWTNNSSTLATKVKICGIGRGYNSSDNTYRYYYETNMFGLCLRVNNGTLQFCLSSKFFSLANISNGFLYAAAAGSNARVFDIIDYFIEELVIYVRRIL